MKLKEKLKKEIDSLPEEYLSPIEEYLASLKRAKPDKKEFRTVHLKGRFDNQDLREAAYEERASS